jgi:hypothetical protein
MMNRKAEKMREEKNVVDFGLVKSGVLSITVSFRLCATNRMGSGYLQI